MTLDPEVKNILEKNLEVSEESLKILKKMRRAAVLGRVFTAARWILVLALLAFGFIQLQPYFPQIVEVYGNFTNLFQNLKVVFPVQ